MTKGDKDMFCTKCGKEIPNDSKFCTNCGNSIKIKQKGKITFHRIEKYVACLVGISVNIDGKIAGSVANGGTLTVDVPIGNHKVIFDLWSGVSQTDIEVTEEFPNVFVDIKIKTGLITNKIEVVNIRKER